jgi:hypothetical protein
MRYFSFISKASGSSSRKGMVVTPSGGGEDHRRIGQDELARHLAAGAAGRAGGVVQIGDGDGLDANLGSELGDGADQSGTLGADRQSVAHVLDVRSGDDFAVGRAAAPRPRGSQVEPFLSDKRLECSLCRGFIPAGRMSGRDG